MIFRYDFDWGRYKISILSTSIWFVYCSVVCRLRGAATLLVAVVIPAWLDWTKSTITPDLIFLNALLILTIWVLESSINFVLLSLLIVPIICFLDGSFVIIWILDLDLPSPLMIFECFWFFLAYKLEKVSLIFETSLMLVRGVNAWVYDFHWSFFSFVCIFFLENSNISLTSLGDFVGIEERSFLKVVGLSTSLLLLLLLVFTLLTFRVNFDKILLLKKMLSLSAMNKFYSNS